jgi:hypothetical protein
MIFTGYDLTTLTILTTKAYLKSSKSFRAFSSFIKQSRHILKLGRGLTCEPQTAMGHSTLGSRVLPRGEAHGGLIQLSSFSR